MGALEGRESSYLSSVVRRQRPIAIAGAVIALLGAGYLTWAIARYDQHADPRDSPGWDRPIADLAFVFQRGQLRVEKAEAQTPSEARLLRALSRNMQFSAGIMVLQVRMFVGTLALLGGCIMMTVVLERSRLLRLIKRLQE
ncbi:MAG TPA: hypothetical protein VKF60_13320 [Myxococcota bacterium]|nr:hypothetical protein [Myxococcota bacterium]